MISDSWPPTTRLSTVLDADCCRNFTTSLWPIEKVFQLMMAFGLLLTDMVLPTVPICAEPETTWAPVGRTASTGPLKIMATARAIARGRKLSCFDLPAICHPHEEQNAFKANDE